jgi:hypothetical protein
MNRELRRFLETLPYLPDDTPFYFSAGELRDMTGIKRAFRGVPHRPNNAVCLICNRGFHKFVTNISGLCGICQKNRRDPKGMESPIKLIE